MVRAAIGPHIWAAAVTRAMREWAARGSTWACATLIHVWSHQLLGLGGFLATRSDAVEIVWVGIAQTALGTAADLVGATHCRHIRAAPKISETQ
jgi:hypothetical protein